MADNPIGAFVPHSPPRMYGSRSGPLTGLTFAVKDLYDIAGYVTGGGSPDWLDSHEPATETSSAVQALLDAGADMIGKTVCDELFYSFTGANAHYGTPLNSRAPDRLPGGSSSGSVAVVAAGLCDFALGSDTGGSVRLPASFCGVYGLRPSHGRIDLSNAMAMSPSMDTAGWFARDAALYRRIGEVLLDDAGSAHPIQNLIIAEDAFAHADPEISAALNNYLDSVRDRLPDTKSANILGSDMDATRECFRTLQAADVWNIYGDWVETARPPLGPGIKQRIEWAAEVTPDDVVKATGRRIEITRALNALVPPGTVVCLPSAASLPPKLTAKLEELEDFRRRTMSLICLSGLSGLPQISIPAATVDCCPVGISFIGWAGGDEALLDLAVTLA